MEVREPEVKAETDRYEQIILDHNNCCLCGSVLQFRHHTDFAKLEVKEEAFCMSCQIRTKTQTATLQ